MQLFQSVQQGAVGIFPLIYNLLIGETVASPMAVTGTSAQASYHAFNKQPEEMMDMSDSEDEEDTPSDAFVDPKTEAFLLGQLVFAVRLGTYLVQ